MIDKPKSSAENVTADKIDDSKAEASSSISLSDSLKGIGGYVFDWFKVIGKASIHAAKDVINAVEGILKDSPETNLDDMVKSSENDTAISKNIAAVESITPKPPEVSVKAEAPTEKSIGNTIG